MFLYGISKSSTLITFSTMCFQSLLYFLSRDSDVFFTGYFMNPYIKIRVIPHKSVKFT
ncbi:hypothetical protein PBCV1_a286bL [Paramecium bursaria Chlorella virus 1]|uniref:Uncharacterized protein n=1 Tax=Paramecium bursaria Chlorella virus 1 TaxID=10506 RepID=F8TU13_PBCV1|nr:hypothetical protein PBCV1_a286bL [Paramecium bursaria Chlorella virus 1]AEI70074.1 hypothetical protein [Paramecium bursaria Chlorella virus 1]